MDAAQLAKMLAWEDEMMATHGWFAHMVGPGCKCGQCGDIDIEGDPNSPTLVNYHTHGLDTIGHYDLQIVLPIDPNLAMSVFHAIAERIKEGRIYSVGEIYSDILEGFDVAFAATVEGDDDRSVLRVILPDANNNLDRDTMDSQYAVQWDNLL